jgi:hypothetical protein
MSRWFRLDDDVINDPKILLLPEALRWIWVAFLCIASKNRGALPAIEIIALSLRVKQIKAAEYLTRLVTAGLIDKTETGFAPHNWEGRQFKSDVSTERVKRFRKQERNVSETPPETHTETESKTDISEANASGTEAPIDPSIAEREFFARGKQVLGKNAGGQLAKLKASRGGNVSLARAAIETAATKQNPAEYIVGVIRGPPVRPLTEFQRSRNETRDILDDLDNYANGGSGGGQEDTRVLSGDPGERSKTVRGGPGADALDLPAIGHRSSG